MKTFEFLKVVNSPFKRPKLKWHVGKIAIGTPYFYPRRWVKATPAFDSKLCHFLGIATMEFNGTEDSVFSEYNLDGAKHMEYLKQHGTFADVPVQLIYRAVLEAYPHLMEDSGVRQQMAQQSLEKDAELEQV